MQTFQQFYNFIKRNEGKLFKVVLGNRNWEYEDWKEDIEIVLQVYQDGNQGNFRVNDIPVLRFGIVDEKVLFWSKDKEEEGVIDYRKCYEFNLDEGFTHLRKELHSEEYISNIIWMAFMCMDQH